MTTKKGFFGFLKGLSKEVTEEEAKQREHALSMAKEDDAIEAIPSESRHYDLESVITDEMETFCKDELFTLLNSLGFPSEVEISKKSRDKLFITITNEEDLGRIIGREGNTLESLQTLIRAFSYKKFGVPFKIILDAGDYRKKRYDNLRGKAMRAARKVIQNGDSVALDPMNAAERRQVHMLFQKHKQVMSTSQGEGDDRHIVLDVKQSYSAG